MPLVGETDGNAVSLEGPELFDKAIIQLLVPLADQKLNDGLAAGKKLRAVAPDAVSGVGHCDALRVAGVPGIFGEPDFLRGGGGIERRQRWSGRFHIAYKVGSEFPV